MLQLGQLGRSSGLDRRPRQSLQHHQAVQGKCAVYCCSIGYGHHVVLAMRSLFNTRSMMRVGLLRGCASDSDSEAACVLEKLYDLYWPLPYFLKQLLCLTFDGCRIMMRRATTSAPGYPSWPRCLHPASSSHGGCRVRIRPNLVCRLG